MPGCMLFAKFLREAESGEGGRPDGHESVANACMRVQRYIQFEVCLVRRVREEPSKRSKVTRSKITSLILSCTFLIWDGACTSLGRIDPSQCPPSTVSNILQIKYI
jgi:hypothetical protein